MRSQVKVTLQPATAASERWPARANLQATASRLQQLWGKRAQWSSTSSPGWSKDRAPDLAAVSFPLYGCVHDLLAGAASFVAELL